MRRASIFLLATFLLAACRERAEDHASAAAISSDGTSLSEPIAPSPAMGPSPNAQSTPAVATDGKDFLAVWSECVLTTTANECSIRAARINSAGDVLDDENIVFPHAEGAFDNAPSVAFDGTSYLVAWSHQAPYLVPQPAQALRVSRTGKLLDASPIALGVRAYAPAVASTGQGWTVAWPDTRASGHNQIYAARIAADGSVVGDDLELTTSDATEIRRVAITSAGDTLLVVWDETADASATEVFGTRLRANLTILGSRINIATGGVGHFFPQVTSDGTNFLVGWNDYHYASGNLGVGVQLIGAADGQLVGTNKKVTTSSSMAALGFDGQSFVLADTTGVLRLGRTDLAAGLGAKAPVGSTSSARSAVAVAQGNTFVLRNEEAYGEFGYNHGNPLAGIVYDASLAPAKSAIRPAHAIATARHVVSAGNGDQHLAVWQEFRADWEHAELRGAIVKANGQLASQRSFPIRSADDLRFDNPSVIFDGTDYVVAWDESTLQILSASTTTRTFSVGARRVNAKGELLGVPVVRKGDHPQLVQAGGQTLLMVSNRDVYSFDNAFTTDGPSLFRVGPADTAPLTASLVFDGTDLVAGWIPRRATEYSVQTRRFNTDGQPRGAAAALDSIAPNPSPTKPPTLAVATDRHGKTLLAWDEVTNGGVIHGAVVDRSGVVVPAAALASASIMGQGAFNPAIAHDGFQWLVGFESHTDVRETVAALELARVQPAGTGFHRLDENIALAADRGSLPSLTASDRGRALVSYSFDGGLQLRSFTDVAGPSSPTTPATPTTPPPSATTGDDDDDSASPTKPESPEKPSQPSQPETKPSAPDDAAAALPETSVTTAVPTATTASGGCSATNGIDSNGFPLLLLVGAAAVAGRRRHFQK